MCIKITECNAEAQINIHEAFVSLLRRAQPSHCGTSGVDYDFYVVRNICSKTRSRSGIYYCAFTMTEGHELKLSADGCLGQNVRQFISKFLALVQE